MKAPELTCGFNCSVSCKDTGASPTLLKDLIDAVRKGIKSEIDSAQITYRACVAVGLGAKVNMPLETEHYDLPKLLQQHFK